MGTLSIGIFFNMKKMLIILCIVASWIIYLLMNLLLHMIIGTDLLSTYHMSIKVVIMFVIMVTSILISKYSLDNFFQNILSSIFSCLVCYIGIYIILFYFGKIHFYFFSFWGGIYGYYLFNISINVFIIRLYDIEMSLYDYIFSSAMMIFIANAYSRSLYIDIDVSKELYYVLLSMKLILYNIMIYLPVIIKIKEDNKFSNSKDDMQS